LGGHKFLAHANLLPEIPELWFAAYHHRELCMPRAQLLAEVESSLIKELKKRLIDEGMTYRDWLERQIAAYLAKSKEQK